MDQRTPSKTSIHTDVLQVPSSSPGSASPNRAPNNVAAGSSGANGASKNDDKHKSEMRKRFYAHKFWPVISKRFYYLSEPELFKAMVKGKGNLRDISQWLAENISLHERLQEYDAKQHAARERIEQKQGSILVPVSAGNGLSGASTAGVKSPTRTHNQTPNHAPSPLPASPSPPKGYGDEEDASPVKAAAKMRQKRSVSAAEPTAQAPDTRIQINKPKVSILEKYRNRQQPRIDQLFSRPGSGGEQPKKRRLVRADHVGDENDFVIAENPEISGAAKTAELLSQKYGFRGDSVPTLKPQTPSGAEIIDELDVLEEKIRANKKKGKSVISVESDGELEQEVFSDDMSAEEDDAYSSGLTSIDSEILQFLNSAPLEDISEICNVPPKTAEAVVAKRPFGSIYVVAEERFEETPEPETKRRGASRKPLGAKIIERTEFSLKGYRAVDSLVKQCSEYGKLIGRQMDRWGVKVTGEGELSIVDVEEKKNENEENGENKNDKNERKENRKIQNEVVDVDSDDDDLGSTRTLTYIRHKPTLLSPEIELKNYQQVGLNWLHLLYRNRLSCILADEMGLGKTCQVIAFMAYLKSVSESNRPHLVVVPSSTLENWLREFHKFCPSLVVQAYYGSQAEREDLRYELSETHYDVLVTTYNLATGAAPDFKFLRSQNFDMIVYDEGHMLKNSASERYVKLMRLKAGFRLLLTGTPLQNNLKELVSLLAFMLPGLFVEKRDDLQGLFNKTAMVNGSREYNPLLAQQAIAKAKTMMTPFVLRRKKAQVLQYLPKKSHRIVKSELTPTQRTIYDELITQGKATKAERERRKLLTGKEAEEARQMPIQSSSNVMMALRKAAMHPLLFRRHYSDEKIDDMASKIMAEPVYADANRAFIVEDMSVMSDYELNALCERFPSSLGSYTLPQSQWLDSGKVTKLLEIVRAVIERKEKVLVFSLFTQMLDVLEKILSFASITFVRLDGSTAVDTRQDLIDRFYEDDAIPVFLLSTKAGGFGINLVAANNVVIYDQSFNPHDDKQAEDRAHRVGQTQEVMVTKLIAENTVDENILMLAENKLQLDHSISNEASDSKIEEKAASMFEKILFGN